MIKTKSVYDPVDPGDGCRILIMRKWPRGIGYKKHAIYKWSKELGPSKGLLEKWNNKEITWRDYVKKYSAEQASNAIAKKEADFIAKLSIDKTVTVLCREPESDPHCHRHILKKTIESNTRKW
ncbi:MAG: DUF488 family protein [Nitrososphaeraceae archaeon]|jgi:uncharacterized protein YeaO (DUF488 family)|nr:DUF488 family protein [Nitrososphaeraceae archaeon]MDW0183147.1 DUF488 family protein [Nitrososphaeraceae archaeon]MDW0199252.1 DUF488 family protein [Nitrososphaeraceae archaeon]MDW0203351.1 DUF488 family protein [Nitrososphaeraceae archaeon]MDW0207611.1 DUF488 family protein [Nitrososphaeraceae archaeon]